MWRGLSPGDKVELVPETKWKKIGRGLTEQELKLSYECAKIINWTDGQTSSWRGDGAGLDNSFSTIFNFNFISDKHTSLFIYYWISR